MEGSKPQLNVVDFPKVGVKDIAAGLDAVKEIVTVGVEGEADIETLVWITRDTAGKCMVGALGRCPGGLDEAMGIAIRAIATGEK